MGIRCYAYAFDAASTAEYALEYLGAARAFAEGLVRDGRGMVYLIG